MSRALATSLAALAVFAGWNGCGGDAGPKPSLDREALQDPTSCQTCHPNHYAQWSTSMHAYAAEDPVFRAMNARGQRETGGALGDFCIKCHAPVAVRLGLTTDGLNLDSLPKKLRGVTCYFCHSVESVEGTHDNPLKLADDLVLRGPLADPVKNTAHRATYSKLHDRNQPESSSLCGSCHDIVTPKGVHLERTYSEWQGSVFAGHEPRSLLTCGGCHMSGYDGLAAQAPGVKLRRVHDHHFPGVDLALPLDPPFPGVDEQRALIQTQLDSSIATKLCVMPDGQGGTAIGVILDNVSAGHSIPSGSSQDRRLWVEVAAYRGDEQVYSAGHVDDGSPVAQSPGPDQWLFRDQLFDEQGNEVHMFWEAAQSVVNLLPASPTNNTSDPAYYNHIRQSGQPPAPTYNVPGPPPDRVTLDLHLRPIGLEVIDSLIQSGDLDPAFRDHLPTWTLGGAHLEWQKDRDGYGCIPTGP